MASASRQLIRQVLNAYNSEFESSVVNHAKSLLLDTLGVSLAAREAPEALRLRKALQNSGGLTSAGSGAILWGSQNTASCGDAALYNGTLAHALELDDFGGADHSGAVVFPAVLAVSELPLNLSGLEFLKAAIAGYEVARRVLEAAGAYRIHNADAGWHSTATCGAPGAAVAAGLVLGLDEDQLVSALGFATTMIGGTWAFNSDGAMSKRLHPGWAANLGVNASLWAQAGITGPEFAFEADWGGFFNTYAKEGAEPQKLHENFWVWPRVLRSGVKPYPCCRDNHSVVDIMLDLHSEVQGQLSNVKRIEIRCIPEMYKMLSNATPKNMVEAQLSMPYSSAVALVDGKVTLDRFANEALADPTVRRIIEKIEMTSDASLEDDAEPLVLVHMNDGTTNERTIPFAKGDHKNPLGTEEIEAKFFDMCRIGGIGNSAKEIVEVVDRIETAESIRPLLDLLEAPTQETSNGAPGKAA
ncbi:MmgE/PrpD family protein [Roseovarius sp. 2305UL8-3]|uniref:MmgE/PrpD family protein n=1 Tax=Roseovarius conchicola TaxID=3121636 RepID=UPI003527C6E9